MMRRSPSEIRQLVCQDRWGRKHLLLVQREFGDELLSGVFVWSLHAKLTAFPRPASRCLERWTSGATLHATPHAMAHIQSINVAGRKAAGRPGFASCPPA